MLIIKSREIIRGLVPTGRYRLTVETDEDGTAPEPLCGCVGGHDTMEHARKCPEAQAAAGEHLERESFRSGVQESLPAPTHLISSRDTGVYVVP